MPALDAQADAWKLVPKSKRIVVKIGSSTLTRDGRLRPNKFTALARDISRLVEMRRQVVVVSSGAIAIGAHQLGWNHSGTSIREKQAAAAVGQIGLIELYQRRFAKRGIQVGQVLLTRAGLEDRKRFLNARRTMLELLRIGVVPIVNENDTIATEEIRFGDNDNLAATIVSAIDADLLIILTDVDGLYERAPEAGQPTPPLIRTVEKITPTIRKAASGAGTRFGSGGMITKLEAATNAARSGAVTILCNGQKGGILERLIDGQQFGTLFAPGERLKSRKHWLAFTAKTRGRIVIDAGAARALTDRGRSLLPAGILHVEGRFEVGDTVCCTNEAGREIARGLAGYSSVDIGSLAGRPTKEISQVLGYTNGDEIIHRDDLVLVGEEDSTGNEAELRSSGSAGR